MCVSVVGADTLNAEVNYHHEQYQTFCYKQLSCLSLYMFVFFTPLFGCDSLCLISNCVDCLFVDCLHGLFEPYNDCQTSALCWSF